MYNQYLDDNSFAPLEPGPQGPASGPRPQGRGQFDQPPPHRQPGGPSPRPGQSKNDLVSELTGGLGQLLDGVRKHFSLKDFDTGDILLVLIILFLYLEGDNLELVITLGLMLLLGLGDDEPKEGDP